MTKYQRISAGVKLKVTFTTLQTVMAKKDTILFPPQVGNLLTCGYYLDVSGEDRGETAFEKQTMF